MSEEMEKTSLITIFTPTYNRITTLPQLYESLCNQSCLDFEWLIVDDGSIDGTGDLIQSYINSNSPFPIQYVFQENRGKAAAINRAVSIIKSSFIYFMDSDDYLPREAIRNVIPYLNEINDDERFCGVTGMRIHEDGTPIGSLIPNPILDTDYLSFRFNYKAQGDYAEIIKTALMKQYPFPIYNGEKFCTETVVLFRISRKYLCRYIDCPLRVTEYLPGGLTDTYTKIMLQSPNGSLLHYKELFYSRIPIYNRIIILCVYWDLYKSVDRVKLAEEVCPTVMMRFLAPMMIFVKWLYKKLK